MSTAFDSDYKQALVRALFWDSQDNSISFEDTLKAFTRGRVSETKTGKSIIATAGNGHSVNFNSPNVYSQITPASIVSLSSELWRRMVAAKNDLISGGTASPTDSEISEEMVSLIAAESTDEAGADFSQLRI